MIITKICHLFRVDLCVAGAIKFLFRLGESDFKKKIISLAQEWSESKSLILNDISWELQKVIATHPAYELCGYCCWAKRKNERHEWCEKQLHEEDEKQEE